jgi:hypothetical protein
MAEDEIAHPPLCIIMVSVPLIPAGLAERKVRVCKDIVLHALVPRNLVRADAVEELVFFADGEAVEIHPGAVDAAQGRVEVRLVFLAALEEGYVGERGEGLRLRGGGVAGEDADGVAGACCEGCGYTYVSRARCSRERFRERVGLEAKAGLGLGCCVPLTTGLPWAPVPPMTRMSFLSDMAILWRSKLYLCC